MPTDIERAEFGKEVKVTVREIIVNLVCERSPVGTSRVAIRKPRHNNASSCAFEAIGIEVIADMAGVVGFI